MSFTGSQAGIDGYADSGSTNFFIPEIGMNWKYRPDLALGITIYGNGGMNTDYPGGQIPAQSACGQFRQGQVEIFPRCLVENHPGSFRCRSETGRARHPHHDIQFRGKCRQKALIGS